MGRGDNLLREAIARSREVQCHAVIIASEGMRLAGREAGSASAVVLTRTFASSRQHSTVY